MTNSDLRRIRQSTADRNMRGAMADLRSYKSIDRIADSFQRTQNMTDTARELGVSMLEVQIVLKHLYRAD
jgi:conjugal transfer/entry exclusion protein